MTGEPEVVGELERFTSQIRRIHALEAAAVGGVAGAVATVIARWSGGDALVAFVAGAFPAASLGGLAYWKRRRHRTRSAAAATIERHVPVFRNLVITAAELSANPDRARPWMRARVMEDTARSLREHAPRLRLDVRRPLAWFATAYLLWAAALAGLPRGAVSTARQPADTLAGLLPGGKPSASLRVVVEPPAYTRLPAQSLKDPDRVDAIEGSRLRIEISGRWRVRFGSEEVVTARRDDSTIAETTLTRSGYLALEPARADTTAAARLLAIAVTSDRTPSIHVDRPGRDLLLPNPTGDIPLQARATDDFGLTSFELRYTKVSGTGEQFEFVEGTLPVTIGRDSGTSWRAVGRFDLTSLRLDKGDSLVYRLVARDGRPGPAGSGASDTYFIEIAGPGQVALAGVDMPPERERYALSQQMIVLEIERLRSRETGLDRTALRAEVETIAAEQRAVRANFIFLMGGHVEDEEVEAEQSHEIQEGRLENRARRDIASAVRHMTSAEQGLAAIDTAAALPAAKAAVDALQRAFGHSRYILRTLPVRSRIDPSRRLARAADARGEWVRDARGTGTASDASRARALLARLLAGGRDRLDAGAIGRLAEDALSIDPASKEWQDISARLMRLGSAIAGGGPSSERDRHFDAAVASLVRQAEEDALPRADVIGPRTRLFRAWAEGKRP